MNEKQANEQYSPEEAAKGFMVFVLPFLPFWRFTRWLGRVGIFKNHWIVGVP